MTEDQRPAKPAMAAQLIVIGFALLVVAAFIMAGADEFLRFLVAFTGFGLIVKGGWRLARRIDSKT